MIVAFAPIVGLLLGVASIHVPWGTLLLSVLLYIGRARATGAVLALVCFAARRAASAGCRD